MRHQAELSGFCAIENGSAGAAHRDPGFNFFRACGTFDLRLGIVEPWFIEMKLTRGAAIEVGDKHWIMRAFPLEVGGRDESAMKFVKPALRIGQFVVGGLRSRGNKHSVEAAFAGVVVDFASKIFRNFARPASSSARLTIAAALPGMVRELLATGKLVNPGNFSATVNFLGSRIRKVGLAPLARRGPF